MGFLTQVKLAALRALRHARPVNAGAAIAAGQGSARSMTTVRPVAPILTTAEIPSRSPLCGVAFPDFEMRAPTMTFGKFDSARLGAIAIESSSLNAAAN